MPLCVDVSNGTGRSTDTCYPEEQGPVAPSVIHVLNMGGVGSCWGGGNNLGVSFQHTDKSWEQRPQTLYWKVCFEVIIQNFTGHFLAEPQDSGQGTIVFYE